MSKLITPLALSKRISIEPATLNLNLHAIAKGSGVADSTLKDFTSFNCHFSVCSTTRFFVFYGGHFFA
jgi:hypothetical protein